MLRTLLEKVDNIESQMGSESRNENSRKDSKANAETQNTTEMKNVFDELTGGLVPVKNSSVLKDR